MMGRARGWDEDCGGGPEVEIPDVIGSLRGLRTWRIHNDGYLHGITYPERWTSGVNVARCLSVTSDDDSHQPTYPPAFSINSPFILLDGKIQPARGTMFGWGCPGVARGNHGCGFFAVHGRTTSGYNGEITGVIDAFGQVELGPKGFRCEKARIVALTKPPLNPHHVDITKKAIAHARTRLEEEKGFVSVLRSMRSFRTIRADLKRRQRHIQQMQQSLENAERDLWLYNANVVKRFDYVVSKHYPDAVLFDTIPEMLAEFPTPSLEYMLAIENAETEGLT